jgi:UDP-N-acetyl-D-galactosamine dehydrogenase
VGDEKIRSCSVEFTSDEERLKEASFIIVAVPTPVKPDHTPDLSPVEGASHIVGRNLQKGSIVVYESTVYPGVTEEVCVPILEQESGLKCGVDFKVGYSPERINPGDKKHRLNNIIKIFMLLVKFFKFTIVKKYTTASIKTNINIYTCFR